MSSSGIQHPPYIPPVDPKDPQSLDNASRDFLDVLNADRRLAVARDRERDQGRNRRGPQTPGDDRKPGPALALPGPASAAPEGEPQRTPAGPLVAQPRQQGAPPQDPLPQQGAAQGDPVLVRNQGQSRGGIVGETPGRLPTGAPQQPPGTGMARGPQAAPQIGQPPLAQSPPGFGDGAPFAVVDARTLALLANGGAGATQTTGRLVGPINGAAGATRGTGETFGTSLVGPAQRAGLGLTRAAAATLSAVTPTEVRERIQLWMATGVLDTSPFRFPPFEPLAQHEPGAARGGTTRGAPVSPLARTVGGKPAAPTDLTPANDGPGPWNPLAANDGVVGFGQAMMHDMARRGSGAPAQPHAPAQGQPQIQPQPQTTPQGHAPVGTPAAQQASLLGSRGGGEPARPGAPARGVPTRPFDFAAAEAEERALREENGVPTRLDVPGLGIPRV
ncbi:hypothetical protein ACTZWW_10890 [Salinarimonas sp. NSM]|uniref:hypothetical protein n=1 Tax=Salinarimonas sp. NSM TaxID=3458003 RepID=UPI0040370AAB